MTAIENLAMPTNGWGYGIKGQFVGDGYELVPPVTGNATLGIDVTGTNSAYFPSRLYMGQNVIINPRIRQNDGSQLAITIGRYNKPDCSSISTLNCTVYASTPADVKFTRFDSDPRDFKLCVAGQNGCATDSDFRNKCSHGQAHDVGVRDWTANGIAKADTAKDTCP